MGDAWKIAKAGLIDWHENAIGCQGSRGDDEIVCTSRFAGAARVGEQPSVLAGDTEVVVLDRNRREHARDILLAHGSAASVGQLDTDEELGRRDRRDRDIILVADEVVERESALLKLLSKSPEALDRLVGRD